ncbi:killer cell lectin-like receptor subfamily B member 1B allele B [Emydura macquarii macquarii]|uniref:killer cell lectin-like receptor subfamily B member 1B allele B n=1 Tax=Emydura macquarii macquarii TaxID=1129001 RepID=UPI003529FCB8
MAQEIVYADLNIPSSSPGCRAPRSSQPLGPPQIPPWHRTALGIGNIALLIAVIALGFWVSHLVSEKGQTLAAPDCHGAGSRDTSTPPGSGDTSTPPGSGDTSTAECCSRLERFRSQLTQSLCYPAQPGPAAVSGYKLCPMDWRLHGDKCYWVSRENKMWNESRADCSVRGSQLLVIWDPEELEFLKNLTQGSKKFWVGLSVPSPQKAWAWLNSSRLDLTQFPELGQAEENSCGTVKGNQTCSDSCSSAYQWICKRDAVRL